MLALAKMWDAAASCVDKLDPYWQADSDKQVGILHRIAQGMLITQEGIRRLGVRQKWRKMVLVGARWTHAFTLGVCKENGHRDRLV